MEEIIMIGGKEICKQIALGNIKMEPFYPEQAGPNSYDLRLAPVLVRSLANSTIDSYGIIDTHLPGSGIHERMLENGAFLLEPGQVYLGCTVESFGSDYYVPVVHGRSTAARHGVMVHIVAGFCDAGFFGNLVLEIVNMNNVPILLYPGDRIAQVSFERIEGEYSKYNSTYQNQAGIMLAKSLGD